MILIFAHGWGFDAGFWAGVTRLLPQWRCALSDRGYFGVPADPRPDEPVVAITHSLGTMQVLRQPPPQCRGLIAINGFDCFTARGGVPGVARRVIDRMIAQSARAPGEVLAQFRTRCGSDEPFGPFDGEKLMQDLIALRDMDCRADAADWSLPILSLQGGKDTILPAEMRANAFSSAANLSKILHPIAGHLLPQSEPEFCARHIASFMAQFA